MDTLDILVTNDDGIDSAGFHALYDALSDVASVTAVAPADDQSAVGRTVSQSVSVREHELGYVIDGTPVDCVVAGLSSLAPETDLVVAGCNQGANMGGAVLGRSGTVSAVVEGVFHGVPGIAASLYISSPEWEKQSTIPREWYDPAVDAAAYFASHSVEGDLFEYVDYLNINAPTAERCNGKMEITTPSSVYELSSKQNGDRIELHNPIWEMLDAGEIPDGEGTDRRAVIENKISVSPLTAPHSAAYDEQFTELASRYSNGR